MLLTFDLPLQKDIITNCEREKRKRERKEEEEEKEDEEEEREEGERKKKRKMTTPMAERMARDGEWPQCPHHPQGSEFVCVEAGQALATARKWRACHERIMMVRRALDGWRDERWALERPSPTPDLRCQLHLPPISGWVCTPREDFVKDTRTLTAATLELARCQLDMEKKEEEERRRTATPAPAPRQVSE